MIPLDKKTQKRLRSLIGKSFYCGERPARNVLGFKYVGGFTRMNYTRILMAHKIFNEHEFGEEERVQYWRSLSIYNRERSTLYTLMPRSPRKDNKDYKSGGGNSNNPNTIRYPKKVRKTAWKRFLKLFPFAKDKR